MGKKFSESGQKIRIFLTMSWGVLHFEVEEGDYPQHTRGSRMTGTQWKTGGGSQWKDGQTCTKHLWKQEKEGNGGPRGKRRRRSASQGCRKGCPKPKRMEEERSADINIGLPRNWHREPTLVLIGPGPVQVQAKPGPIFTMSAF